jgi:hypothetical protein
MPHAKPPKDSKSSLEVSFRIRDIFGKGIAILISGLMGFTITYFTSADKTAANTLSNRVSEVEAAIASLKKLENYLEQTKKDIQTTVTEKVRLDNELHQLKELEKLSGPQFDAISQLIKRKSKWETFWNYFWGAVFGIGTSMIGSYLYGKCHRRPNPALNSDPAASS